MWSFDIEEVSNGAYFCKGTRATGNTVSLKCGEDEVYRVFEQAYFLEVELGTPPTEALYNVVSGSKPYWESKYESENHGSWTVQNPSSRNRYVYDGMDSYLAVYKSGESPEWQGRVEIENGVKSEFFRWLAW